MTKSQTLRREAVGPDGVKPCYAYPLLPPAALRTGDSGFSYPVVTFVNFHSTQRSCVSGVRTWLGVSGVRTWLGFSGVRTWLGVVPMLLLFSSLV